MLNPPIAVAKDPSPKEDEKRRQLVQRRADLFRDLDRIERQLTGELRVDHVDAFISVMKDERDDLLRLPLTERAERSGANLGDYGRMDRARLLR